MNHTKRANTRKYLQEAKELGTYQILVDNIVAEFQKYFPKSIVITAQKMNYQFSNENIPSILYLYENRERLSDIDFGTFVRLVGNAYSGRFSLCWKTMETSRNGKYSIEVNRAIEVTSNCFASSIRHERETHVWLRKYFHFSRFLNLDGTENCLKCLTKAIDYQRNRARVNFVFDEISRKMKMQILFKKSKFITY